MLADTFRLLQYLCVLRNVFTEHIWASVRARSSALVVQCSMLGQTSFILVRFLPLSEHDKLLILSISVCCGKTQSWQRLQAPGIKWTFASLFFDLCAYMRHWRSLESGVSDLHLCRMIRSVCVSWCISICIFIYIYPYLHLSHWWVMWVTHNCVEWLEMCASALNVCVRKSWFLSYPLNSIFYIVWIKQRGW